MPLIWLQSGQHSHQESTYIHSDNKNQSFQQKTLAQLQQSPIFASINVTNNLQLRSLPAGFPPISTSK